ncbi:predicted protein [Lichtheimia corymbifera JMRC:FSU:9682]|uniref:Uncharacterized protein n=1 Tax=Lichtheimia corymbifera JMRC:FSU:9682 TaxID=1263082 RepID=A0A068S5K6_9FUNG|nr:predicted protein [Lichtheimia corymbifera JMRC:FSU:9682]
MMPFCVLVTFEICDGDPSPAFIAIPARDDDDDFYDARKRQCYYNVHIRSFIQLSTASIGSTIRASINEPFRLNSSSGIGMAGLYGFISGRDTIENYDKQ